MPLVASPWLFGLGGAFIYAGPRLSTCLFAERESRTLSLKCWVDFVFSVAIGPIAAESFTGSVQGYLHTGPEHIPAIAALIGLLANPMAPSVIQVTSEGILKRVRALMTGGGT